MADWGKIGELTQTLGDVRFEWRIPNFLMLSEEVDNYYTSPYFPYTDSIWYLVIYPNGDRKNKSEGWIGLYLHRGDSGAPKSVQYTLGIKRLDNVEENIYDERAEIGSRSVGRGVPRFLDRLKMKLRMSKLVPSNTFTVTCRLRSETRHVLQGGKFLSRASQTEELPKIINDEDKEEKSVSFDMRGITVLSERLKDLLLTGHDHDVSIKVKDREFRAHKSILCTRSPVFAMMFRHDSEEKNTGVICIEDCDPDVFGEFLVYVYSGKAEDLSLKSALGLYYAADKYDFPVLKERCAGFLKTALTTEAICDVILLAAKHEEKDLLGIAMEYFMRNIEEILTTEEWQSFLKENPVEANELYIKSLKTVLRKP